MAKENAHKTKTRVIKACSFADAKKKLKKVKDFEKIDYMRVDAIVSPKIKLKELNNFARDCLPEKAKITICIRINKLQKKARAVTILLYW